MHTYRSIRPFYALLSTPILASTASVLAQSQFADGFFAYCTSNHDATGVCVNQETSKEMDCIIVPGAIIRCKTLRKKLKFECVWVSSAVAGGAQFWCDPKAEQSIINDLQSSLPNALQPAPGLGNSGSIDNQLFDDDLFSP